MQKVGRGRYAFRNGLCATSIFYFFSLPISHMPLVMDISSLVKCLFLTGFDSNMSSALKAPLLYFELHKSQYSMKKYSKFNSPCPICPVDVHLTATIRYQPNFYRKTPSFLFNFTSSDIVKKCTEIPL